MCIKHIRERIYLISNMDLWCFILRVISSVLEKMSWGCENSIDVVLMVLHVGKQSPTLDDMPLTAKRYVGTDKSIIMVLNGMTCMGLSPECAQWHWSVHQ